MITVSKVLTSSLLVFFIASARAGDIVQPISNRGDNLYYGPDGQTFTAEDPRITTIGFLLWNASASSSADITYDLYAGSGSSGSLLGSSSLVLPQGYYGYADADFSFVSLTVGQTYTVMISTSATDCLVNGEQLFTGIGQPIPGTMDYSGGQAIYGGQDAGIYDDLTFRILAIPEPNMLPLLFLGLFLFSGRFLSTNADKPHA